MYTGIPRGKAAGEKRAKFLLNVNMDACGADTFPHLRAHPAFANTATETAVFGAG